MLPVRSSHSGQDGFELLGELRHGKAIFLSVAVGHAQTAPEIDEPQMVEALGDLEQALDGGQVVVRRQEQRADVHVDAHYGEAVLGGHALEFGQLILRRAELDPARR